MSFTKLYVVYTYVENDERSDFYFDYECALSGLIKAGLESMNMNTHGTPPRMTTMIPNADGGGYFDVEKEMVFSYENFKRYIGDATVEIMENMCI